MKLEFVKSKTVPKIQCPTCHGSRVIELKGELRAAFDVLASSRKGFTSSETHKSLGLAIGKSAVNNRLEDLRRLGLAERTREGRNWRYKAIKRKTK